MIIERWIPPVVLFSLIITSAILTAIGLNAYGPWVTALLWTIGIIFFFVCCIQSSSLNQVEIAFFILSLIICIVYVYSLVVGHDLKDSLATAGDAFGFWKRAVSYWRGDFSSRYYTFFPYLLYFEFFIFDQNYLCCILFNVLFSELAIFKVLDYAGKKFGLYTKPYTIAMICFFPYVFKIASSLWREAFYIMFLAYSFLFFIKYVESKKQSRLYIAVLLTIPVIFGHSGYFPIPLIYFIASLAMNDTRTRRNIWAFIFEMIILLAFVRVIMEFNSIDYLTGGKLSGLDSFFVRLAGSDRESNAGSAYLVGLKANNWMQVFLFAPLRLLFYSFSPLPMNWRGMRDVVTFIFDSFLHFIILFKVVSVLLKYINTEIRKKSEYQVVKWGFFCCLLTGLVFALGTSTAGTAIRHRDSILPIEWFIFLNAQYIDMKARPLVIR